MESLNNIIFQDINDRFAYGLYLNMRVIIMKENGYVNATNLCNLENKEYRQWKRNQYAQELIRELEKLTRENSPGLEIVVNKGPIDISGTNVHSDQIPHIASWCSAQFAIKVSKIVNVYAINEFKLQIAEKDRTIEDKNIKINEKSIEYVPHPINPQKNHVFYITRESDSVYKMHRVQVEKYKQEETTANKNYTI